MNDTTATANTAATVTTTTSATATVRFILAFVFDNAGMFLTFMGTFVSLAFMLHVIHHGSSGSQVMDATIVDTAKTLIIGFSSSFFTLMTAVAKQRLSIDRDTTQNIVGKTDVTKSSETA